MVGDLSRTTERLIAGEMDARSRGMFNKNNLNKKLPN
jgi:hypothetical protein